MFSAVQRPVLTSMFYWNIVLKILYIMMRINIVLKIIICIGKKTLHIIRKLCRAAEISVLFLFFIKLTVNCLMRIFFTSLINKHDFQNNNRLITKYRCFILITYLGNIIKGNIARYKSFFFGLFEMFSVLNVQYYYNK